MEQFRMRQHLSERTHSHGLADPHQSLLRHHSSPLINLVGDIDLHWTYLGARAAERRVKWQLPIFAKVQPGIGDHTDRTGIRRAVTQAPASPVYRAGIHASSAANTLQAMPEVTRAQPLASRVVHQNDVQLPSLPRPVKVRCVLCDRRAERTA